MAERTLTRSEALTILRRHGIHGAQVYLVDLIPLVEIVWADGKAQESEIALFDRFLERHVGVLNRMAGYRMLEVRDARHFVLRFLRERPSPELLRELRDLVPVLRLSSSDESANESLRSSLLAACMEIASSTALDAAAGEGNLFDGNEKRSFFEILDTLEGRRRQRQDG